MLIHMRSAALFTKSAAPGRRLRVGVLFPGGDLPPPARQLLESLGRCEFVQLVAGISVPRLPPRKSSPGGPLYRFYRSVDAAIHPRAAGMLAPRSCVDLMNGLAPYSVDTDATGEKLTPTRRQSAILASCQLDVIIALGATADCDALAEVASFGVWRARLGDPLLGDIEPRLFAHTICGTAPICIAVQANVRSSAEPVPLAWGRMSILNSVSTIANLFGPLHMGECLLIAALRQLHSSGWDALLERGCVRGQRPDTPRAIPSDLQVLTWGLRKPFQLVSRRLKLRNTQTTWEVAVRVGAPMKGLAAAMSGEGYRRIEGPEGHYYADPFLMSHGSQTWLFMEDFDIAAGIGVIIASEVARDGSAGPAHVVLQRPYHLSYPQVVFEDGEYYMIPETGFNRTVELYRAVRFPYEWTLEQVLFDGPAFDATLLRHEGTYWFFVSVLDVEHPQNVLLMLYFADSLRGEWTLHPASPIASDIGVARCAGACFLDNGQWIRPAQDGTEHYGGAVRYQRITRLDRQHYAEEPAGSLTSHCLPGTIGVHTYNREGAIEVIDYKTRIGVSRKTRPSAKQGA
jgi:hypothetical protein